MEEASTSGHAAQNDNWRGWMDGTVRIRNLVLMWEAVYKNPNLQLRRDDVIRIAELEGKMFQLATNEHEYLLKVSDYIQMEHTREIPKELGGMPTQRSNEPVGNILQRHRGLTDRFKNIVLGFIERHPISMMSRQQLPLRLHVFRASLILSKSLDKLTKKLESPPEIPSKILEEDYEDKIRVLLEKFLKHENNTCTCPHATTIDVYAVCPNEDKTCTSLADEFQRIFRAFSEVAFSEESNIEPPQCYKALGSTSKRARR